MRKLILTAALVVLTAGAGTADAQWHGRSFGGTSFGGRSFGSTSFGSPHPGGYYRGSAVPYYAVPYYQSNVDPVSGRKPSIISGSNFAPGEQPDTNFGWRFWR